MAKYKLLTFDEKVDRMTKDLDPISLVIGELKAHMNTTHSALSKIETKQDEISSKLKEIHVVRQEVDVLKSFVQEQVVPKLSELEKIKTTVIKYLVIAGVAVVFFGLTQDEIVRYIFSSKFGQ